MYILKIILCLLILEIPTYIGFYLSKNLKEKVEEYNEIDNILVFLESQIKYGKYNLIEIFEKISHNTSKSNFKKIFRDVIDNLKNEQLDLQTCFSNTINENKNIFLCNLDVIKELSKSLGKTDIEDQVKLINLSKERVKKLIDEAVDKKNKNEKIYKSLGVICGIMLVIVLI